MNTTEIYTIPQTEKERMSLRRLIIEFIEGEGLTPPVSMDRISELSDVFMRKQSVEASIKGWIMVEMNNGVWKEMVAATPYDKRILLLPKCLSNSEKCKADVDELGLLCNLCQNCNIPDLQDKAEELGMMSLVAEGFTSVIGLVENKVIDAVIGVSCLDSLEKAFPLLINNAVPGLAVSLNMDGCKDTNVDLEYVEELMTMKSDTETHFLDYENLKSSIRKWFSKENLSELLSASDDLSSVIAREWIGDDGKRWRPYLLAATYMAHSGKMEVPLSVEKAALAVECFHKASLVHDDIQDNDTLRYGKQTVYASHGVPIAINVGDLYLGEGYRLLAETGIDGLVKVAAEAHIALCKGQGMELEWIQEPRSLEMDYVLNIFRLKTVPAFDVSLMMGVLCAREDKGLMKVLNRYSEALGIAYQLQDDIEDFEDEGKLSVRPSAVLASVCRQSSDNGFISSMLRSANLKDFFIYEESKDYLDQALIEVKKMQESYHREALNTLNEIRNSELKRMLFRLTKRMLK